MADAIHHLSHQVLYPLSLLIGAQLLHEDRHNMRGPIIWPQLQPPGDCISQWMRLHVALSGTASQSAAPFATERHVALQKDHCRFHLSLTLQCFTYDFAKATAGKTWSPRTEERKIIHLTMLQMGQCPVTVRSSDSALAHDAHASWTCDATTNTARIGGQRKTDACLERPCGCCQQQSQSRLMQKKYAKDGELHMTASQHQQSAQKQT